MEPRGGCEIARQTSRRHGRRYGSWAASQGRGPGLARRRPASRCPQLPPHRRPRPARSARARARHRPALGYGHESPEHHRLAASGNQSRSSATPPITPGHREHDRRIQQGTSSPGRARRPPPGPATPGRTRAARRRPSPGGPTAPLRQAYRTRALGSRCRRASRTVSSRRWCSGHQATARECEGTPTARRIVIPVSSDSPANHGSSSSAVRCGASICGTWPTPSSRCTCHPGCNRASWSTPDGGTSRSRFPGRTMPAAAGGAAAVACQRTAGRDTADGACARRDQGLADRRGRPRPAQAGGAHRRWASDPRTRSTRLGRSRRTR